MPDWHFSAYHCLARRRCTAAGRQICPVTFRWKNPAGYLLFLIRGGLSGRRNGGIMKKIVGIFSCIMLVLMLATALVAADDSTSSTTSSTSSTTSSSATSSGTVTSTSGVSVVTVTNITTDPEVFFPYEKGSISVTLTNSGDTAVGLSGENLLCEKIFIVDENTWKTMDYIGAGSTMTYTFPVTVNAPDGTYYGLFTVSTKDGGSIHYPFKVKVDSREIKTIIEDKPDYFSDSNAGCVNVTVINLRDGAIKNILITPEGSGFTTSPAQKYVSLLAAQGSVTIPFEITPSMATNVTFNVSYQNGDTTLASDVVLPITLDLDKTAASPVVNNVVLVSKGTYYDLTGDITNAGITDAKGLVVSLGSPATGTGTYPEYAIGSIASDDSGSFELTFTSTALTTVPLIIRWKDSDGNDYHITKNLDLTSTSGSGTTSTSATSGSSGMSASPSGMGGPGGDMGGPGASTTSLFSSKGNGISSFYPVIAGGIILVAGIVLWKKRKWLSAKLKKQ